MKKILKKILDNKLWLGVGIVALCLLIWLGFWLSHSRVFGIIGNEVKSEALGSITGAPCETPDRRPLAVMLPSDPEARPLSGISQADLVIEMPVTPDGITRMMAVYQCQTPKEIGSVRSAREDFIPLAAGFNSIYAHWGGEAGSLQELNSHVIDNINALYYDGTIFYRKSGVKPPNNGFTTPDLLYGQAEKLNYDLTKNFSGYPHSDKVPARNLSNVANLISLPYKGYSGLDSVVWNYDQAKNIYLRSRGNATEIDKNTNTQASASVVIVMNTKSHVLRAGDQYMVVNTTGSGSVSIYQNGVLTSGQWKKDPSKLDSKLMFVDENGKEIEFVPGSIWIEISTS